MKKSRHTTPDVQPLGLSRAERTVHVKAAPLHGERSAFTEVQHAAKSH